MTTTTLKAPAPPKHAQDPLLGTVRYCPDCNKHAGLLPFSSEDAYFPADTEFFHYTGKPGGGHKLHSYCKACYAERLRGYRGRPLPWYLRNLELPL